MCAGPAEEHVAMRPLVYFAALVAFCPTPLFAQQLPKPPALDVCDAITTAEKYAGQIVELRGIVYSAFEDFSMGGVGCKDLPIMLRIWLAFPDEAEVKNDPSLRGQHLKFKRNEASKRLDHYLKEKCGMRRVDATLRGRLQYRQEVVATHSNGSTSINGYGHMSMHDLRLVILSVVEVGDLACSP
jgi:hypothetical protein